MNRFNDWKNLLNYANEELKRYNRSLAVEVDKDGYYHVVVIGKGGKSYFAQNNLEDELVDIINAAWHEIRAVAIAKKEFAAANDATITITCYNKTEKMSRKKANRKYLNALAASEGSEHERYENIYFQLIGGFKKISDQTDWRVACRKRFQLR